MRNKSSIFTILIALLILWVGFFAYRRVIEKKMENLTTQTIKIRDINSTQIYSIVKLKKQKSIYQVQLTITGQISENCTLYLGPKHTYFNTELRIKKGVIETALIDDWYSDSIFIKVENLDGGNGALDVEYQFLGLE